MTTARKPVDLDAVRKLADEATPGPWQECGHDRGGCQCGFVWSVAADALLLTIRARDEDVPTVDDEHCRANAKFIAEARTLVPAMADEIEALRTKLAKAEEAIERAYIDCDDLDVMGTLDPVRADRYRLRSIDPLCPTGECDAGKCAPEAHGG